MQLAKVNGGGALPAELDMDEQTRQLFEALEERLELKLDPMIESQRKIEARLEIMGEKWIELHVQSEQQKSDMARMKEDLNNGLASVRREVATKWKIIMPTITAVATLLTGVVVYWLRT